MATTTLLILFILVVVLLISVTERGAKGISEFRVEDEYETWHEGQKTRTRSKKRLKHPERLWRGAVVIYKLDTSIHCPRSSKCSTLMRAMHEFSTKTCVRFQEWTGEHDFVHILMGSMTSRGGRVDHIGRKGGAQKMTIDWFAWQKSIVLHEMGHVLGLFHELARPDRDLYVDVFPENIRPECMENLEKLSSDEINLLGKPFDTKSIMMYSSDAGAKGKRLLKPTYKTKSGRLLLLPKFHLSAGDVKMINDLYRCSGSTQKPSFPVDVLCDFTTRGACGFKWQPFGTWKWQENPGDTQGFLVSKLSKSRYEEQKLELWTVNFHGLSPLDTERGPDGCVHFKYLRHTMIQPGLASLKLFQVDLITPFDQKYEEAQSFEIWSDGSEINQASELETWNHVSVRINVSEPFMLKFVSKFADHSPDDEIKIGGFELRYAPCEDPGVVSEQTRIGNAKLRKNYSNEPTVGITKTRSCWWRSFTGLSLFRSSSNASSLLRSSSIASSTRSSSHASPLKSPSSGSLIRSSKLFSGNKQRPKLYN